MIMKILYKINHQIVLLIIFVLTFWLFSWGERNTASAYTSRKDTTKHVDKSFDEDTIFEDNYEEPAEIISMISLIANPEKYHGKILRVFGYLNLEFEGNAIYLHKEDCEVMNPSNGLWVDTENNSRIFNKKTYDKYDHKYVFIQGTFDMNIKGHFGMWSGSIRNITSVDVYKMFHRK